MKRKKNNELENFLIFNSIFQLLYEHEHHIINLTRNTFLLCATVYNCRKFPHISPGVNRRIKQKQQHNTRNRNGTREFPLQTERRNISKLEREWERKSEKTKARKRKRMRESRTRVSRTENFE